MTSLKGSNQALFALLVLCEGHRQLFEGGGEGLDRSLGEQIRELLELAAAVSPSGLRALIEELPNVGGASWLQGADVERFLGLIVALLASEDAEVTCAASWFFCTTSDPARILGRTRQRTRSAALTPKRVAAFWAHVSLARTADSIWPR